MIERKIELFHDGYVAYTSLCEFTATTPQIPFEATKVSNTGKGSTGSPTTRREPVPEDRSSNRGGEGGSEEPHISTNQNMGKEKREVVWCTTCKTEGHHKNECPNFA
jgi:hypothetical protein